MQAPIIRPGLAAVAIENPARLIRCAFEGGDVAALIAAEHARLQAGAEEPAGPLFNLSILYQLAGRREDAMTCQAAAFARARLFACEPANAPAGRPLLRLLALVGPGDLMANTPVDLMLEGCAVQVTRLVLDGETPLPTEVPDHDVALMAVSEADESRALLARLAELGPVWPRPLVDDAAKVADLARDVLHKKLAGAPGVTIPPTERVPRTVLEMVAAGGGSELEMLLPGGGFPLIARPVGSHAGKGLERIEDAEAMADYLAEAEARPFYLSPYLDYASPDGRFRKYRIIFFDGRPYLCHLAIGDRWMVHYLNAGMGEDEAKRAEEGAAMAGFDQGFAGRHAEAFAALHQMLGLDLFAIDCAEAPDGSLLIFEADVAMVVHDLDPPALYPYKKPQMRRVFDAFEALLRSHAARALAGPTSSSSR